MAQAAPYTCEICTAGPGEHYCQQCDQIFCGSCKLSHFRTKTCKNHTFVSGTDINKEENVLCTEHEESFLFYCHDCDTPVCRICSVEKHSRHLMTDLTRSTEKLKYEVVKNIELKLATSKQNISKIEKETKTYRERVKAVIKTITDESNYLKKLIDKKVESFIRLVQGRERKEIQNMTAYSKVHKGVLENCQTWQQNIKKMETTANVLLLQKLKKIKTDVDQIVLKQIPDAPSVSYRIKKPSGTEIENLFGELQFWDSATIEQTANQEKAKDSATIEQTANQEKAKLLQNMLLHEFMSDAQIEKYFGKLQFQDNKATRHTDNKEHEETAKSEKMLKSYTYVCMECQTEQVSNKEPETQLLYRHEFKLYIECEGLFMKCSNRSCYVYRTSSGWHDVRR